jgi:ribosomal protein S18 acetylase RimI-like enzyme
MQIFHLRFYKVWDNLQAKLAVFKIVYNGRVPAAPSDDFIRPVDPRRDLSPIADLIELCFAHQMDDDGRDYLRHIRRAARDSQYQRWVKGANEQVSVPLFGYVWEEDGQIIGNLSIIPFKQGATWRYLIANVATHPNYRGRGIARQLTQKGIEHTRQRGASAVWLQVRDDNPVAYQLYLHLGFQERARRTTWNQVEIPPPLLPLNHVQVSARKASEWPQQAGWLQQIYPGEVAWNLNFSAERYAPGLVRSLIRFFNNERVEQWSVHRGGLLLGMAIWDAGVFNSETVWVAPNPECENLALQALVTVLRNQVTTPRPLSFNYPAGRGCSAFQQTGFTPHNTLIWMEINLENVR